MVQCAVRVSNHDGFAIGRKCCSQQMAISHDEFCLHGPGTRIPDLHMTVCMHCDEKFAVGGEPYSVQFLIRIGDKFSFHGPGTRIPDFHMTISMCCDENF